MKKKPSNRKIPPPLDPMKVMLALNDNAASESAFTYYITNMYKENHKVYIVYEAEQPEMPIEDYSARSLRFSGDIQNVILEHEKKLNDFKQKYSSKCKLHKIKFEIIADTTQSRVGSGIITKAEQLGVELIVTGARDRGSQTGLGSISSYIVGNSKIPVLICQE